MNFSIVWCNRSNYTIITLGEKMFICSCEIIFLTTVYWLLRHTLLLLMDSLFLNRRGQRGSRVVGQKDDIHLCIMCLRAIMNYEVFRCFQTFSAVFLFCFQFTTHCREGDGKTFMNAGNAENYKWFRENCSNSHHSMAVCMPLIFLFCVMKDFGLI